MLLEAHRALGATLFYLGAGASALTHLEQGMALYDPQQHGALTFLYGDDPGVVIVLPPGRCGPWAILTRGWRGVTQRCCWRSSVRTP
jgi:hypothetical protein